MASIGTDSNGHRRILFVAPDGSRKTVRLGKVDQKTAEAVCRHVEALLSAKISGQPVPRDTAVWLASVRDPLRGRLARAGLIDLPEEAEAPTLAAFIDGYIDQRADLKAASRVLLRQARDLLVGFLGGNRRVDEVTPADADAFRAKLLADGLAKATVRKRCYYARHFFAVAVRRRLIAENPFGHISGTVVGDPARRMFVPGEVVRRVMDVMPDPQWRLLLALARWGGLRIPSEALALTWADVDFAGRRFIVRSSKTAHHADGGIRVVPMFPELADLFQQVFDEAAPGTTHVITRYRGNAVNLRTQLQRYIERAGVKPWPKLWQNLRASRATELADRFPSHVCAAWLGHTEKIADAFYRQVTDEHFARAVAVPTVASITEDADGNKAAQNPAQQREENSGKEQQFATVHMAQPVDSAVFPCVSTGYEKAGIGSSRIRTCDQGFMRPLL